MGSAKPTSKSLAFRSLRSFYRQHWKVLASVDLVRTLGVLAIAFQPWFFAQFVDSVSDPSRAATLLVLFFALGAVHSLLWTTADYLAANKVVPLVHEYKKLTYAKVWDYGYQNFVDRSSGKIGAYVNGISRHVLDLWDAYHYGFLSRIVALPVFIFLFFVSAWQSSLIYAAFLIVATVLLLAVAKPLQDNQGIYTDLQASNDGRVFDSYANFVNVFSFGAKRKEKLSTFTDIDSTSTSEVKAWNWLMTYWATASVLVRLILWGLVISTSWYFYSQEQISFADLVLAITILMAFTDEFWESVHHLGEWVRNSAEYEEAYEYLFSGQLLGKLSSDEMIEPPEANELKLSDGVEIKKLGFAYPDAPARDVLSDINLSVPKGTKVGLVGRSGEGKSTLVKLLLGFYQPKEGSIEVDGERVDAKELASLYSYVPQDTTLFQESIFYNLSYATTKETSLEEVVAAAKKANIHDFIEQLPEGYNTYVGERGIKLSLGQRQRIAIARAFLRDSELLILDEATSALDSETESYVQEALEKLWENKSAIVIAHRLSTLRNVDRIAVLDGGRVVEEGSVDELLTNNGVFADLWNRQKNGMIAED